MAKLALVSALLVAALLAVAAEASFRTTISTIVDEESQWGERGQQPQRCQQQMQQRRQQLQQCEQMLSQQGRRSDMDIDMESQYGQQQQQRQCCQGLESLDRRCRCEAVNQMVQDMMQGQGQGQGRQASRQSEMIEKARHLPDMCNLEPHQCQIQSPSFISTMVDEESQWGERGQQPQRCQQQIQQKRQQLRRCEQMLSQQGSRSDMEMINQYGQGGQQQLQQRQCCQGLESLDRQCRCEAVNQMVQDMMQGQGQGRQAHRESEMMEKARYLPDMCNLEPRHCQIQSPYF